jgi:hypothetical protein
MPTNTKKLSPLDILSSAMDYQSQHGTNIGFIEKMERHGQEELVNENNRLPIMGLDNVVCEKFGILDVKEDADDPLFAIVTLPKGWRVVQTDHDMWSNLVDEKGRVRANIFYKAAFYDRRADINFVRRYKTGDFPEDNFESRISYKERKEGDWYFRVIDTTTKEVVFSTPAFKIVDKNGKSIAQSDEYIASKTQLSSWLKENLPNYGDVTAYWD